MTTPTTSRSRALGSDELAALATELDTLRRDTLAGLGEREASYIRRVRSSVVWSEVGGRGLLFLGWLPPAWLAGTALLSFSKIVENMELGHNVMHGQYDWMHEPAFDSRRYDWDTACPADAWHHSHNYLHHRYTNVEGRDRDLGYGLLRLTDAQPWRPAHLLQPLAAAALATLFQWGVALHDLELDRALGGEPRSRQARRGLGPVVRKGARQVLKDYVLFPAIAGPAWAPVLLGNLTANLARNLWAFSIIFCGHFTADAETFAETALAGETRGQWYVRQLRASSNLEGGPVFHFMSGNLSHQIEHHLFPDIPAVRYADMAGKVREVCARYGQHYNTGSFLRQFGSVVSRILRYSLPRTETADATAT